MVRRFLLLIFSAGLIFGGSYLLFISLNHPSFYAIVRGTAVGGFLIFFGAYLLWDDFIKPRLGVRGASVHRSKPVMHMKKAALPLFILWNILSHVSYRYHKLKYPDKKQRR